jgi:hypothetical protein
MRRAESLGLALLLSACAGGGGRSRRIVLPEAQPAIGAAPVVPQSSPLAREIVRIERTGTGCERSWAERASATAGPELRAALASERLRLDSPACFVPRGVRCYVQWALWMGPRWRMTDFDIGGGKHPRYEAPHELWAGEGSVMLDAMQETVVLLSLDRRERAQVLARGERFLSSRQPLVIGPIDGARAVVQIEKATSLETRLRVTLRHCTPSGLTFCPGRDVQVGLAGSALFGAVTPLMGDDGAVARAHLYVFVERLDVERPTVGPTWTVPQGD